MTNNMKNNRDSISIRHALMLLVLLLGFPYFGYAYEYKGLYFTSVGNDEVEVSGCDLIGDVEIPASITVEDMNFRPLRKDVIGIGSGAFQGKTSITSVTIPREVTSIGESAFKGCSGLTSFTLEYVGRINSIGESAFEGCSNLTSFDFSALRVESIPNSAFKGCSSLRSIRIPADITSIGESAFEGCSGLTSIDIDCYDYRNVKLSIGESAFEGCSGLTSVKIPERVTSIGNYAFEGCSGLTSVEIPNSVTSISIGSFKSCTGLTSIEIPNSVTSIGFDAFNGCTRLHSIKLPVNFANRNVFGIDVYYLTGEYEQKSSDFPNLLFRDNAKNHKRLWEGAKIIKTSLTDSLELANYLSGLTISTPQVLIVPTGCYDYAVEGVARDFEGLSIIEDHNNMQFSLTSWEDDLWKLAKDAYAQLNEITQLSSFTSLKTDLQNRIKDMLRDCAALQKDREKEGNFSRYNVTYTCLSLYNENLCLMLPLLIHAQELNEREELLYIDEKLFSDFNMAYQETFNSINEHPLLITKQEIKKLQLSYDAALAACNEIRNFHDDLRNLLQLAETLKENEWYGNVPDTQKAALDQAIKDAQAIVDESEYDASFKPIKASLQNAYDAVLASCNGIKDFYDDLRNLLQLAETLKKNEWYGNVPDTQKAALDQAIEDAQATVDKGVYDASSQQVKTTLEDAYHVALKSSIQQLVSQVKSYTETDIANIYSYLDGKKVVDEVMARVMAELDTDNYSSMLQIADSLQVVYNNVKIEAEKYGAELQNAKQNANQLITNAHTLLNETYKDIYAYLDADNRNALDVAVEKVQQKVAGYDKIAIVQAADSLQIICNQIEAKLNAYSNDLQGEKSKFKDEIARIKQQIETTNEANFNALDEENRNHYKQVLQNAVNCANGYSIAEIAKAKDDLSEVCSTILGIYDQMSELRTQKNNLIQQLSGLSQEYPYSYEALDYKTKIEEAKQNAQQATSIAQMQQAIQQMQTRYDSAIVMINDLQDKDFDREALKRVRDLVNQNENSRYEIRKRSSYAEGLVEDRSQIVNTNNDSFYTLFSLDDSEETSYLTKGDLVDIKLSNNIAHSCLLLYGISDFSQPFKVYCKRSADDNWVCVKECKLSSDNLSCAVIDFNKITTDVDSKYIRLEYVGEAQTVYFLRLYRRDDLMDDDAYHECVSMVSLLDNQIRKNDVQRSLTKDLENLTSKYIDEAQDSASFINFVDQTYTAFMPNEDTPISDIAKTAYVICEVGGQVYRRTCTADNDAYLVKGAPVILQGLNGCCINLLRSSGGKLGQPIDTTGSILKISKESDRVNGGYVFEKDKFNYTDYQIFDKAGTAYFKVGNRNMGNSFGIEKLKEVSTIVSSVSTVTDNNTKLRVYDVSGRYIPVKDLSKLPAGAYIVNGKKVVVK